MPGISRQGTARAILVGLALIAALAPLPPALVERWYSNGLYRAVQPAITALSNRSPIALFDVLIVCVSAAWIGLAVRDRRRPLRTVGRTIVWSAALYLAFLALWGLNYRRIALGDRLAFDRTAVTDEAVRSIAEASVVRLNALHPQAHQDGWPGPHDIDAALSAAFARAQQETGGGHVGLARPKTTLLDWYFRRAGVDGMTDPFFLETLVAGNLLPFERPFVFAHEWAHLSGITDEGEANFMGWLTCVHGPAAAQYSGWLFLYGELLSALPPPQRAGVATRLAAGPRADLRAIADRASQSINPTLSAAGWRVYDQYLRANRVESGTRSYAEVVRLVAGVTFGPDWTPSIRGSTP